MEIIPAIDIIDGKCVRLTRGDYNEKTIYNDDPLEVAMQFEDAGLRRLHLVDLDGAKAGEVKNWKVLERIAAKTNLLIDFSGGISTAQNLSMTFSAGATYVSIGSLAVKNELILTEWFSAFGVDKFIIATDVKEETIFVKGWTEKTVLSVFDLVGKYIINGVKQFICTDINNDGLLQGPSTMLYKKILNQHPSIDLIASGGISSINDLEQLRQAGCSGAIIGKAIYEGVITLNELQKFTL